MYRLSAKKLSYQPIFFTYNINFEHLVTCKLACKRLLIITWILAMHEFPESGLESQLYTLKASIWGNNKTQKKYNIKTLRKMKMHGLLGCANPCTSLNILITATGEEKKSIGGEKYNGYHLSFKWSLHFFLGWQDMDVIHLQFQQ